MLKRTHHTATRARQSGVTLIVTLIVLVAMTLATIALMRSVDTTNIIAGNLAFQQSAKNAADDGTEQAINTLLPAVRAAHLLNCNGNCPLGYQSWHNTALEPPNAGATWETYWNNIAAEACDINTAAGQTNIPCVPVPQDPYGNTVSYFVESMCDSLGQNGECAVVPPSKTDPCSSDLGASTTVCNPPLRYYYRVTSRVIGPRNSVSYVQVMLAM